MVPSDWGFGSGFPSKEFKDEVQVKTPKIILSKGAFSLLLIAGAFALGPGDSAHADDWPQWLGPKRDGVWRETGIVDKFPEGGPKVRWRQKIGPGYSGPAVAHGRVYLMDRELAPDAKKPANDFARGNIPGKERIICLNEADGAILWTKEYDCPYTISYSSGPRTTPIVHDKKVYTLGAEGNLYCLDAEKGQEIWSLDLKKEYKVKSPIWGFSAHPLLDGQKLICIVGGENTTAVAFDKDTGKEIWHALTSQQPGYCPPMIYEAGGKRQLIIWNGEEVHGLDPETGKVYWTEKADTHMGMAISTPRKLGEWLFLTGTFNHSKMFHFTSDQPGAKLAWKGTKETSFDSVFGTPWAEGDYLYGTDSDGNLCCIQAETGKRLWTSLEPNRNRKGVRSADIFIVKLGDQGDRFLLFNDLGDLILAEMTPKGYKQISSAHLLDPSNKAFGRDVVWSHPAFANRCVYARNDKEIICVSLAKE
jgi:outer membrane protein assembly factor BamB